MKLELIFINKLVKEAETNDFETVNFLQPASMLAAKSVQRKKQDIQVLGLGPHASNIDKQLR